MTLYNYKAAAKNGTIHKGQLEASSKAVLKVHLQQMELSLIATSLNFSFPKRKVKPRALMDLCLHLEQFEKAGIPLLETLDDLTQSQTSPRLKAILKLVYKDVDGGNPLSKALSKHPTVFDSVFIGLISAGEKTGQLAFVLHHLFQHLKWMDVMQAQIFKALRYPLIMMLVLMGVFMSLMTTLVPELVKFMEDFAGDLPLVTRLLIGLSDNFSLFLLCVFSLILLCVGLFKARPALMDHIPFFGPLRHKIALARFCHVFAVMFEGGIDILEALQTARSHLKEGQMHHALERAERLIQEGHTLSSAFQQTGFFPPLVIHMIRIGEKTSSLQTTIHHVKEYFDTILKRQVDHTVSLLEPVMTLCIGGFMGWIIYAIFIPLYDTFTVLDY